MNFLLQRFHFVMFLLLVPMLELGNRLDSPATLTERGQASRFPSFGLALAADAVDVNYTQRAASSSNFSISLSPEPSFNTNMSTYFDTAKRNFKDVPVDASGKVSTTEYLEAAESAVALFGMYSTSYELLE
jgi:hypothetical protein